MTTRLNNLLTSLAHQYAPAVLQRAEAGEGRVRSLALLLARNGVLVLPLVVPPTQQPRQSELINELVSLYASFYRLLTDALFPSLKAVSANYADADNPPVLVIEGNALPVIAAFANYVVPFVAANWQQRSVNLAEVQGILNFMLDDLEGQGIAPQVQRDILKRGSDYVTQLLGLPLQQQALTPFARAAFLHLAPEPPEVATSAALTLPPPPETPRAAPPPPEVPKPVPTTPFVSRIPIIFDAREPEDQSKSGAPVRPPDAR